MKSINHLRSLNPKIRRELVANVIAENCVLRYKKELGLVNLLSEYHTEKPSHFINQSLIWVITPQGDNYWRRIWEKLSYVENN